MTGDHASRARPLRPSDPRRLGSYEVTGRLGEGGMGTVYLATTAQGVPVALKVIRTDLSHDPEFRRRFRGEVDRARQVPPFCTAEVLDADPEHEPPYLVVEYVDGPSLAAMVDERGPLSPANLHGLAIGVATALTAIHGAGVIHRDLKPTNVLLAPGSPKVIDFGIARPVHGASGSTANGQLIGTIAYMAPERFGQTGSVDLTPAADVFAWGAVVAYAGTGRTPHRADSPEILAVQILTQPPNLDGLSGPLRALVEQALDKDPARRPTARDLLDGLLTGGPTGSRDLAVALARQPALLRAAEDAQAVTDHHPADELVDAVADAEPTTAAATELPEPASEIRPPATELLPGNGTEDVAGPRAAKPPSTGTDAVTALVPLVEDPVADRPPGPPSGRKARVLAAVLTVILVLGAGLFGGAMAGIFPLFGTDSPPPPPQVGGGGGTPTALPPNDPAGGVLVPPGAQEVISDELGSENLWEDRTDAKHKLTCEFDGALVVTKGSAGTYRCPGPKTPLADLSVAVEVRLLTPGSCAGVWFRFKAPPAAGYALRICRDSFRLVTHGFGDSSDVTTLEDYPLASPIPLDTPTRVGISAWGSTLRVFFGDEQVGEIEDTTFADGHVVLGIFQDEARNEPPYSVSFSDIRVWRLGD